MAVCMCAGGTLRQRIAAACDDGTVRVFTVEDVTTGGKPGAHYRRSLPAVGTKMLSGRGWRPDATRVAWLSETGVCGNRRGAKNSACVFKELEQQGGTCTSGVHVTPAPRTQRASSISSFILRHVLLGRHASLGNER